MPPAAPMYRAIQRAPLFRRASEGLRGYMASALIRFLDDSDISQRMLEAPSP